MPRGPRTRVFKICPWDEKRPCPEGEGVLGHLFYIEKKPSAMIRPRTIKLIGRVNLKSRVKDQGHSLSQRSRSQ